MASEQSIALDFIINADKANLSLGELEQGYEALKNQLKETNRNTEEGRKQFKELSTQLASTGREVKNIELSFEALDNEQVASELGSVAGAVGDVTASFVLLGGENETMQEMAASIEKAMAISMGFKGAIEGVSSGMKLYNNLLKQSTVAQELQAKATKIAAIAQKALNFVMKANPIALIITGIIALAAAYKLFSKEVNVAAETQKAYADASDEAEKSTVKEKISLDRLVETAKNDNLSKSQRMEAIDKLNKMSPEYLGNITIETINTKEATAAIGQYVDSLNKKARAQALENQLLAAHNDLIDLERKAKDGELEGLAYLTSFTNAAGVAQDNQNRSNSEAVRIQKEKIQGLTDLINAEEEAVVSHNLLNAARGIGLDIGKLEKTVTDGKSKREADAEARRKAEFEARKNRRDIELVDTRKIAEEEVVIEQESSYSILSILDVVDQQKRTSESLELEAARKLREERKLAAEQGLADAKKVGESLMALNDAVRDNAIASIDAEYNRAKDTGRLTEAEEFGFAKKKDALLLSHFNKQKKLNMAMAAINTAQAIMNALATAPYPLNIGLAAAAGVTGALQIAAIKKQQFQGGAGLPPPSSVSLPSAAGGAAEGSGGAQIDPVSNTNTVIGNNKVFVSETDITGTQNKVNVIEQSATF